MIKSYYDITLKDVILLDATKSAKHLKKYWFVPLYFCHKQLEKLAAQMFEAIENKTVDTIQDDFDKLLSYRNIQILEILHKLLNIELKLKSQINVWKIIAGEDYIESKQLEEVLADVLKFTGIDIKEPKDIDEFEKYVEYRIDKHKEMFQKKIVEEIEAEGKEHQSPIAIIYSYFNYLNEDFNEDLRLIVFVDAMKKLADERMSKTKIQEDEQQ